MRSKAITANINEPFCENIYNIKNDINVNLCNNFQVQPIIIRKQPKFPTRERHLAIRRKKSLPVSANRNGHNVCER